MRTTKLCALLALFSLVLFGQANLAGSCQAGGEYPNCLGGEIVFTGVNYPATVHVTVTNSSGEVIDDGTYTTDGGVLRFVENLSFSDTYRISLNGQIVLTVTTV
jgi:hypothetical protein